MNNDNNKKVLLTVSNSCISNTFVLFIENMFSIKAAPTISLDLDPIEVDTAVPVTVCSIVVSGL